MAFRVLEDRQGLLVAGARVAHRMGESPDGFEVLRDYRQRQDRYFDYAEALLQIAIVLASISIVTGRNGVRWLSLAMATVGAVLMLDAFTMLAALPFL